MIPKGLTEGSYYWTEIDGKRYITKAVAALGPPDIVEINIDSNRIKWLERIQSNEEIVETRNKIKRLEQQEKESDATISRMREQLRAIFDAVEKYLLDGQSAFKDLEFEMIVIGEELDLDRARRSRILEE